MKKQIEKMLKESASIQHEVFVREVLNYLEMEFRKICLSLLNEITASNIIVKSMYAEIAGLQRPSWGCWNGFLNAALRERRRILNTGSIQQREIVGKSKEFHWISKRMEQLEEILDEEFKEKWANIGGQILDRNKRSGLKTRELLSIPIQIRNRVAHDNVQDRNWWADVRYILGFITNWYLRSGIEKHFSDVTRGEPWLLNEAGEVWCYNGIDIKGEESSVFYVSLSGKSKIERQKAGSVIAAFQKILGEENLQEANFKKLMNKLAPEELKGFFLGGYIVGEKSGEGGFAEVYKGIQLGTGRKVALKILKHGLSEMDRARFLKEAEYLSRFDHPNIAKIYEQNEQPWRKSQLYDLSEEQWFTDFKKNHGNILTYIVMEWIEGATLDHVYREMKEGKKQYEEKEIAEWFMEAVEALEAIHNASLIHRDISPKNIMITESGTIKLMDFGISRAQFEERTIVTSHGKLMGSEPYMSPEQLDYERAKAELGPKSDIYSLGSTFYELFTRTRLYNHNNDIVSIATASDMKRRGERPKAPNYVNRAISWEISTILMGCLENEAADRYESAQKLKEDIKHYLNDQPIKYKQPTLIRRMQLTYRRNLLVTNLSFVFITIIVISTAFYINSVVNERIRVESINKELQVVNKKLQTQIVETEKQKNLADKNGEEAKRQAVVAKDNEAKAKANADEAIKQKQEAEKQSGLAKENEIKAEKNAEEAKKQAVIAKDNEKLANQNAEEAFKQKNIAEERKSQAEKEKNEALKNESLVVSKIAKETSAKGEGIKSIALALKALPTNTSNPERPYVTSSEVELYDAIYNYNVNYGHSVLTESNNQCSLAQFSKDSKYLLTVWDNNTVKVCEVTTGKEKIIYDKETVKKRNKDSTVSYYAEFSSDSKHVYVATGGDAVDIVDLETLTIESSFLPKDVTYLKHSPDGKYVAVIRSSVEGNKMVNYIEVFDEADKKKKLSLENCLANIDEIHFSQDSKRLLVAGYDDGTLKVFDLGNDKQLCNIENAFYPADFSADGSKIAGIAKKKLSDSFEPIAIWDADSGNKLTELKETKDHSGLNVKHIVFSFDGKLAAASYGNGVVNIWEVQSGKQLCVFLAHEQYGQGIIKFSSDGKELYVCSSNEKNISILDTATGKIKKDLKGHESIIKSMEFSSDNKFLATISADKTVRVWKVKADEDDVAKPLFIATEESDSRILKFSPDGMYLLTRSYSSLSQLIIRELQTGNIRRINFDSSFDDVSISQDGKYIAAAMGSKGIAILDFKTGKQIAKSKDGEACYRVSYSKDNKYIFGYNNNDVRQLKDIKLWDSQTGEFINKLKISEVEKMLGKENADIIESLSNSLYLPIYRGAYKEESKYDLKFSNEGTLWILDKVTGKTISRLEGHKDKITSLEFSPDYKSVTTVSEDKTIKIWDVNTGRMLASIDTIGYKCLTKYMDEENIVIEMHGDEDYMNENYMVIKTKIFLNPMEIIDYARKKFSNYF